GDKERDFWDEEIPGFCLRIREGGSRKFFYRYRIGDKQRRISLGPATSQTVTDARARAARYSRQVADGGDPALDKAIARAEAEHTVGSLIADYLKFREPNMKGRSYEEIERHLNINAKSLHDYPITKVAQSDIAKLLNGIDGERGPVAANRTRSSLSAFFGWVLGEGTPLPAGNPVSYTNKREEKSRERVLTHSELKRIWEACNGDEYGAIVKLLMLTGQRREEIAALRCSEINEREDQIELPGDRTKNGRPHIVPLSDAAKEIL